MKEALLTAIHELRPHWSPELINWLMDLVSLSLESSFARYGKDWYRSLIGIPTGGALSVTLANIAVFYVLRKVVYNPSHTPPELLGIKRFVDDMGGVWCGSFDQLIAWSNDVNSRLAEFGLSIKEKPTDAWDINLPEAFTVLLDIKFRFDTNQGLITDVNIKETDSRSYLHFNSYHPRQYFPQLFIPKLSDTDASLMMIAC